MTFRTVKLLGFLHRLELSVPEMQKYVFGTLDFGQSKKKLRNLKCNVQFS